MLTSIKKTSIYNTTLDTYDVVFRRERLNTLTQTTVAFLYDTFPDELAKDMFYYVSGLGFRLRSNLIKTINEQC